MLYLKIINTFLEKKKFESCRKLSKKLKKKKKKKKKKNQDMTVPFARARAKLGGSIR